MSPVTYWAVPVGNLILLLREAESRNASLMREADSLVWSALVLLFRSRVSLEAEILMLRPQLNIQRRHVAKRVAPHTNKRRDMDVSMSPCSSSAPLKAVSDPEAYYLISHNIMRHSPGTRLRAK
jgi:hypothetical protein